jgi:hypothetical protein
MVTPSSASQIGTRFGELSARLRRRLRPQPATPVLRIGAAGYSQCIFRSDKVSVSLRKKSASWTKCIIQSNKLSYARRKRKSVFGT